MEQSGISPIKSPAMMLRLLEAALGFWSSSHLLTHSHCFSVMVCRETRGLEAMKHRSAVRFRPATKKPSVHKEARTFIINDKVEIFSFMIAHQVLHFKSNVLNH